MEAKKIYGEVMVKDFKGNISLLRSLELNLQKIGVETHGYYNEDNYQGQVIIKVTKEQIEPLLRKYGHNLSILGASGFDTYEEILKWIDKKDY